MAHEYSVRIHDWITGRLKDLGQKAKAAGQGDADLAYIRGQLRELEEIRQYLTDKIDLDTQQYYD